MTPLGPILESKIISKVAGQKPQRGPLLLPFNDGRAVTFRNAHPREGINDALTNAGSGDGVGRAGASISPEGRPSIFGVTAEHEP